MSAQQARPGHRGPRDPRSRRDGRDRLDPARIADELGAALVELSRLLRRAILPPQIGLTQASTLLILRDEGPKRVTSLAEDVQVTQPTMSGLVTGMERLGWVRRCAEGSDRRVVTVRLTETGENVVRDLETERTHALLANLLALPETDRAALAAAIPGLRGIIAHQKVSKAVAS